MFITSDLLEKYARKECDATERVLVEQWLNVIDLEREVITSPQRQGLKEEIWNNIAARTILAKPKPKSQYRFLYAALTSAACVLFGIISLHYYNSSTFASHILVNNLNGQEAKKINIGKLSFLIEPGSMCNISMDFLGQANDVKFCGAVSVSSDSTTLREFNIGTGTSGCANIYQDKVKLQKGQTYLAMTDAEYNVITATRDEIAEGLPRVFSSRLSERFNL
ncbi:hypothetical protein [Flavobacterium collinsii]|uniref:Uncharacterized protein n=1 Tax=Flavobacterium collinsii TaxID=1114861 RepID=A0A9W4THJ9_9FLAO|nr:hypothetical protein [Flavobacterium collinsii]CAI2766132.1 conserved protein of unknown function [Flavobacterium collinsii]